MIVTDDADLYGRLFAIHDQGHAPNRLGSKYADRPFLGMNFRMTELSAPYCWPGPETRPDPDASREQEGREVDDRGPARSRVPHDGRSRKGTWPPTSS